MRLVSALLLLSLAWPGGVARAGNDDAYFHDNQAALRGGALVGGGTGAGMLYYNPAGLGANDRGRIEVSASAFSFRIRRSDDFFVAETGRDLRNVHFASVPTALSMVRRLGTHWYGGIGAYTTRQDSFNEEFVAESGGGVGTYRIASSVVQNHFGAGFGRAIAGGRLRLGASVFLVLDDQTLAETTSFVRESDDLDDRAIGLIDENQATLSRLGAELRLGVQWAPVDAFAIGLTIRGPRFRIKDDVSVNDTTVDAVDGGDVDAARGRGSSRGSGTLFSYPLRLVVGVDAGSERVRVSADFEYSIAHSTTFTSWRPQWNLRAGLTYAVNENLQLGVGAFTDRFRGRELTPALGGDWYGASLGLTKRKRIATRDEREIVFTTTVGLRYAGSPNLRYRGGVLDLSGVPADGTVFFEPRARAVAGHEVALHLGSGLDF